MSWYNAPMPNERDKTKQRWQFRLSTSCLVVAVVCTSLGWWSERRRLQSKIAVLEHELAIQEFENIVRRGHFNERLAAVKEAATRKDLAQGPALIHALTDPDPRIARLARDGLCRLSGNSSGFGFPDDHWKNPLQATVAWQSCKDWYIANRREQEADYALPDWCAFLPEGWGEYETRGADTLSADDLFSAPSPAADDLFGDASDDEETNGKQ